MLGMDVLPRVKDGQFPYTSKYFLSGPGTANVLNCVADRAPFLATSYIEATRRVAYNLAASTKLGGAGVILFHEALPDSDSTVIFWLQVAGLVQVSPKAPGKARVMWYKSNNPNEFDQDACLPSRNRGQVILKSAGKKTTMSYKLPHLRRLNAFTSKHKYTYKPEWSDKSVEFTTDTVTYDRMYIDNLVTYGRFLAPFQTLSKADRATITINGQPVVECDFSGMHPAILYAEAGLPIPDDLYDIRGVPPSMRQYVKLALLILINAKNYDSARAAIQGRIGSVNADSLIQKILAHHHPISKHLYSNAGVRLMNVESDIAEQVFDSCIQSNTPVLGIHDGFICKVSDAGKVRAGMVAAFKKVTGYTGTVGVAVKRHLV